MNVELSEEAVELGRHAVRALEAAGGDGLVQRAEGDPSTREDAVGALAGLGAWDLDARRSAEELEAAAALCRAAGWWAAPYPVAERLAGATVVDDEAAAATVGGLDGEWVALALDGRRGAVRARPADRPPRRSAFVAAIDVDWSAGAPAAAAEVALALVLPCWTLLGMLDRAIAETCRYVGGREQFGQPLSAFQGVQFQLTDAEVERTGVEVLAAHALWAVVARPDVAVADSLALRSAAIEAADVVFRTCHQLHGAIGFCDETFLSWLSRHSQPLRRLPFGLSATRDHLVRAAGRNGLAGLFDEEPAF